MVYVFAGRSSSFENINSIEKLDLNNIKARHWKELILKNKDKIKARELYAVAAINSDEIAIFGGLVRRKCFRDI